MKFLVILCVTLFSFNTVFSQLKFKSENGEIEGQIIGRALFDGGVFFKDKSSIGNGVELYDARLGSVLRFFEDWTGKLEFGFSKSKVSLKDVYIDYSKGRHLVRAGHFFEPFALEYRIGTSDMKFNGMAGTGDAFGDRRKLGIIYTYNIDRWNLTGGLFGDVDVDNNSNEDEGFSFSGRFLYRPYIVNKKTIHIGVSSRFSVHGQAEEHMISYSTGAPSDMAPENLIRANVTNAINQWKLGAEVLMVLDKWYFQSEYMMAHVNRFAAYDNYNADGFYAQVGYALLKGAYGYNKVAGWATSPGGGSLELLARFNYTNLNDSDAGIKGGEQSDFTLGAIYYINKYIAAKLNYSLVSLDKNALNGKETLNMIQARLQVSF